MANQWFKFKKFMIRQDRCAMKVGTDSVILGSWVRIGEARTALDIGTGTGLLALMLAQRSSRLVVDALEIDAEAAGQAAENVKESPFSDRVNVIHGDFREFSGQTSKRYDLIISNPPYFHRSIAPSEAPRMVARHAQTLGAVEILEKAAELLSPEGQLCMVMPFEQLEGVVSDGLSSGLHPARILEIHATPESGPKRSCVMFSIQKHAQPGVEKLVIEEGGRHCYSDKYRELTRDFYLDF